MCLFVYYCGMKLKNIPPKEKPKSNSVRLSDSSLALAQLVKQHIGTAITKFIENAIEEKFERLPKSDKKKMGVIE